MFMKIRSNAMKIT